MSPATLFRPLVWMVLFSTASAMAAEVPSTRFGFRLSITSELPYENVPMDPVIDFGEMIRASHPSAVLDPNSIEVIDRTSGQRVRHATNDDFFYGDSGRIEWVVEDPTHTEYEIQFRVAEKRPTFIGQPDAPIIGVGDLLRYGGATSRPVSLFYGAGFVDLTGDGRRDFFGCWNYAYRPGDPWDGIICYPRTGPEGSLEFGDLVRIRYADSADASDLKHFRHIYMAADFADFNRDGLVDLVYTRKGTNTAQIFLNSGRRDHGGMPIFTPDATVPLGGWEACRAVDLDGDGAVDLVVDGVYVKNLNPEGWPFKPADPVTLDAGTQPCFLDVDQDGRLDAVCLAQNEKKLPEGHTLAWRRNLGGQSVTFDAPQPIKGIVQKGCRMVAAIREGPRSGLLIEYDDYQKITFYERDLSAGEPSRFKRRGRPESKMAVMSLSDQAWPCLCDWDDDGDGDLLVGGGYGRPRIVINRGTTAHPVFDEPRQILADGKPIRFLRNDLLGEPHHVHNMGYSYPDYVDWDADGLPDLVCPNETNRIYWFKNIGTRKQPVFGKRQQVMVSGFTDSPEQRKRSAELAIEATYPTEADRPFFWRTAAATADFNGDGLMDLVTHDGATRHATLFVQRRDDRGRLQLYKDRELTLADGRTIDDRIVARGSHWTEGFRAVDWDGDGLMDLIYSLAGSYGPIQDGGSIYLLRNCGTSTDPQFEDPQTMRCFGEPIRITNHGPNAWPGDFDGDGKPDLIACVEASVYPMYRHAALMMNERPKFSIGPLRPIE